VPASPIADPDGQVLGRLLLLVGLIVVAVGLVLCGAAVTAGGTGSSNSLGGSSGPDVAKLLLGAGVIAGGGLVAAVGAMVAKSVRRPAGHRAYGAYLDADDDE
jgi:hypothetical protein